jgi:hypothetical protein
VRAEGADLRLWRVGSLTCGESSMLSIGCFAYLRLRSLGNNPRTHSLTHRPDVTKSNPCGVRVDFRPGTSASLKVAIVQDASVDPAHV